MTGAATRSTSRATESDVVLPGVSSVCNVAIWVRSTGVIQVAQVVKSSGSSSVDQQCAWDAINGTMEPAKLYGVAIDKLLMIPMKWMKGPSAHSRRYTTSAIHRSRNLPIRIFTLIRRTIRNSL